MYKKQMTLQRVACLLSLAAAALVFIYSLGLMTNLYDTLYLFSSYPENHRNYVEGASIYLDMQPFNRELTTAAIILILTAVALFVFRSNDRRRYYIANYITIGVNAVANVVVSIWAISNVIKYKAEFLLVDFVRLKELSELLPDSIAYSDSTFWFDAGYFVFAFVFLATAISVANLVLKIVVMRSERKLIEEGKEA